MRQNPSRGHVFAEERLAAVFTPRHGLNNQQENDFRGFIIRLTCLTIVEQADGPECHEVPEDVIIVAFNPREFCMDTSSA